MDNTAHPMPIPKTPSPTPIWRSKWMLIGLFVDLLIIIPIFIFVISKISPSTKAEPVATPSPKATQTPDPHANWNVYNSQGVYFMYPSGWATAANQDTGEIKVYDPKSVKSSLANGGAPVENPSVFFSVQQVTQTDQTASAYTDYVVSGVPYATVADDRQSTIKDGMQIVLFTAHGEGSYGKYLVISNGSTLVVINTSLQTLDGNSLENQILDTFKFVNSETTTECNTDADCPTGKKCEQFGPVQAGGRKAMCVGPDELIPL